MSEDQSNNIDNPRPGPGGINRRDLLKGLMTVPLLGVFSYGWYRKQKNDQFYKNAITEEVKLDGVNPVLYRKVPKDKLIRIGIIGTGGRGLSLLKGAGFLSPNTLVKYINAANKNNQDKRYVEFMEQEDLNLRITGVCDVFDINAQKGISAGANIYREGLNGKMGEAPKRYKNYRDLIAASDVDAVIIATPDHWHGPMIIEAARAGKHVYVEKPMTWTIPETYEVVKAVKDNNIVFQLGHQNRQTESYFKAREAVKNNVLGKISLIEVTTNRNSPEGAWVYKIHEEANSQNIDWEQFIGPAPWNGFSLERFFRWRCWWDYSTGLSGDLFTHDYDAMNQILDLGIPHSAVASGGIYFYKDGRTVPDVLQMAFEYPDREFTLLYSASLASSKNRGRTIMGHDAWLDLENNLKIYADPESTRFKEKIEKGLISPEIPIYSYKPGFKHVDAVTSPTEEYYASRGLLYTYLDGKRLDPTHLHIKDWLNCIRGGGQPSCNIDQGFQEAMTAHMGTVAYKENRRVYWDNEKQIIV